MFYIALLLLIILALAENRLNFRNVFILSFSIILIVTVLRFGIGADYFSYEYIYNNLNVSSFGKMLDSFTNIELGFRLISFIGRKLGLSFHLFISIFSIIGTSIIGLMIYENKKFPAKSFLLYYSIIYLTWDLNAIRQGIVIFLSIYILFSNRLVISDIKKFFLITLLSIFHISVLVVIPIYYLSKLVQWNSKKIFYLFLASILLAYIPYYQILNYFTWLPYIGKIQHYFKSSSIGLLNLQAFLRLFFFVLVYYHYNRLKFVSDRVRLMVNYFLISLTTYFAFSSIQIVGARVSVYGFILIIFILPEIIELYSQSSLRKTILTLATIIISVGYFEKDFKGAIDQSGYQKDTRSYNLVTYFNHNRLEWTNMHNLLTQMNSLSKERLTDFNSDYKNRETITEFANEDTYIAVKIPNSKMYTIINQRGEIVTNEKFSYRPVIYGDMVEIIAPVKFKRVEYLKIDTMELVDPEIAANKIASLKQDEALLNQKWYRNEQIALDKIENTVISEYIPNFDTANSISLARFGSPIWYNIIEISIYNQNYYVIMDNEYNLKPNRMYSDLKPYASNYIAQGITTSTVEYINQDGDIIWIESRN